MARKLFPRVNQNAGAKCNAASASQRIDLPYWSEKMSVEKIDHNPRKCLDFGGLSPILE
jgi:hypothetical protein